MPTVDITYNDKTLTVQGDSIAKRVKENMLRRALRISEIDDPTQREIAYYAVIYLSHIKRGCIGLDVPNEGDDMDTVLAFLDKFGELDEALLEALDTAVVQTRTVTNDADLLPPGELPDTKKKTKPQSKSD